MKPRLRIIALLVALLSAAPAIAQTPPPESESPAAEDALESAGAHFARGVEFYKKRNFEAALTAFKRAYEVAPNYRVMFNLGQTSFELQDYVEALRAFETYLEEGGDEIPEDRRAEVESELARLGDLVGRVELQVGVDGAEVAVDDRVVGTTPLSEPILVNPGRRRITLRREAYAPLQRVIEVPAGEQMTVKLELTSLTPAPQPGPVPTPVPVPVSEPAFPVGFWTTFGMTLAVGAGAAIAGGLTLVADADHDDALNTAPTSNETVDDAASEVERRALVTDILLGVTGALAATTVVFGIVELGGDDEEDAPAPVEVGLGAGTLSVRGRF